MKTSPRSLLGLLEQMNVPAPRRAARSPDNKRRENEAAHYQRTKPCVNCGGHLFYKASDKCVPCTIRKASEYHRQCRSGERLPVPRDESPPSARQVALANGETHYRRPEPCKNCGGTDYYTKANSCVTCHRESARVSAAEKYHRCKQWPGAERINYKYKPKGKY